MNLEVAGSSPAEITTTNYQKIHLNMFTYYSLMKNKEFVKTLEEYENEEDKVDAVYTTAVEHFDVNIAAATFGDNNENGPIFLEMPDENFDERIEEDG